MKNYRPQYHITAILKTFFQAKSDRGKEKKTEKLHLFSGEKFVILQNSCYITLVGIFDYERDPINECNEKYT